MKIDGGGVIDDHYAGLATWFLEVESIDLLTIAL